MKGVKMMDVECEVCAKEVFAGNLDNGLCECCADKLDEVDFRIWLCERQLKLNQKTQPWETLEVSI